MNETDAAEVDLARVIDSQIDGTIITRSEHHPNCPGGGPDCALLCPVPVQDYGDTADLAAAILASDWLAAREAAARAEERERVAVAIEAQGRVCSDAHGMECIGGVAYRDAASIARTDGAGS